MSKYTLKRKSSTITLTTEAGVDKNYELREMSASKRDTYLDKLSKRIKTDAEGKASGVSRFEGLQAELICQCLYNEEGKQVQDSEVQSWPASTVAGIFKDAQAINKLEEELGEAVAEPGKE